jgi:hypothetical protein
MEAGIYRKVEGKTGVGQLYLFIAVARHHDDKAGAEYVVYVPLRVEREWAGTVRHCILERKRFEKKFEYVGEGLPEDPDRIGLRY